jgi:vitamin B12 transporter
VNRSVVVAWLAIAAPVAAPASARAQESPDTFRLPEMVVTATRMPVPLADAPGSVTVVTGATMRERGLHFVADALRTVPGVSVAQSAGPGALASVFMRGGESDYVQVLVDGVQVNDPGGAFNWAHLRAEDIERIEIVRGPASVLYGSDAVSGVVQIFTRAGGARRINASIVSGRGARPGGADGSFDTHAFDVSATGSASPARTALRYGVSAGHTTSTGLYAVNSGYDNTTVSTQLDLRAGSTDIALSGRRIEHEYHYPTSGSGMVTDLNQFAEGTATSLRLALGHRPTPGLELIVEASAHGTDARTEDPPDEPSDGSSWYTSEQTRRGLDARANILLPHGAVLTVGAAREWQDAATAYESVSGFGTFADSSAEARRNTGYYVQLHAAPARSIAATLGARLDRNEAFGSFRTARAALSWRPTTYSRLHAAVGTAFKEPTFYENFATGFVRGNRDLEPERSRSHEAGIEYSLLAGRLAVGATAFDQRFRNLIQYTAAPPAPDATNYYNVGSARARGTELSLQADAGAVTLSSAYTFTATRVIDSGFGSDPSFEQGEPLLRRPKHHFTAAVVWSVTAAARALVDLRHAGRRTDLDFTDPANWDGTRTTLDGHTVLDIGAGYTLRRRAGGHDGAGTALDITLRVHNVMNTGYEEIFNFPAPGRVLQIGLRAGR